MFWRWTKVLQVWNCLRVSNRWQNIHFLGELSLLISFSLWKEMWGYFGTHKLCELFVAYASMRSLKAFRVHTLLPFCVDVTETDGGQHLYWGWLLLDVKWVRQNDFIYRIKKLIWSSHKTEKNYSGPVVHNTIKSPQRIGLISLCWGLFPLCCANFVVLWLVTVVLC